MRAPSFKLNIQVATLMILSLAGAPRGEASMFGLMGLATDPQAMKFMNSPAYAKLKSSGALDAMLDSGVFEKLYDDGTLTRALRNGAMDRLANDPEMKRGEREGKLSQMAASGEMEALIRKAAASPTAKPKAVTTPTEVVRKPTHVAPAAASAPLPAVESDKTTASAPAANRSIVPVEVSPQANAPSAPVIPAPGSDVHSSAVVSIHPEHGYAIPRAAKHGHAPSAVPAVAPAPAAAEAGAGAGADLPARAIDKSDPDAEKIYTRHVRQARAPRPQVAIEVPARKASRHVAAKSDFDRMIEEGFAGLERIFGGGAGEMRDTKSPARATTKRSRVAHPNLAAHRAEAENFFSGIQSTLDEIFGAPSQPVRRAHVARNRRVAHAAVSNHRSTKRLDSVQSPESDVAPASAADSITE